MARGGVELASGYISLAVRYSGAMAQIAKDLERLEKSGKSAGKTTSDSVKKHLGESVKLSEKKWSEINRIVKQSTAYQAKQVRSAYAEAEAAQKAYSDKRKEFAEKQRKVDSSSLESIRAIRKEEEALANSRGKLVQSINRVKEANAEFEKAKAFAPKIEANLIAKAQDQAVRNARIKAALIKRPFEEVRRFASGTLRAVGRGVKGIGGSLVSMLTGPMARIAGITAILGGVGYAFNKGFQQISAVNKAEKALQSLNYTARDFNQMMKSIEDASKGTQFGVVDLVETATKAVQGGVAPGGPLTEYLKKLQDISTVTGKSVADIQDLYDKAKLRQEVWLDDMRTLGAATNAPVSQWVTEDLFAGNEAAFQKAIEMQKLGWDDVLRVLETRSKGTAVKMSNTLEAQLHRIGNVVGNIGAAVLEPFFASGGGAVKSFVDRLEEFAVWLKENQPEIVAFVTKAGTAILNFAASVADLFETLLHGMGGLLKGMSHLPFIGNDDMRIAGEELDQFAEKMGGVQNRILKETIPAWEHWGKSLENVVRLTNLLGYATPTVLDNGRIEVVDFEGDREKLKELGFEVKQLGEDPTHLELIPKTKEAVDILNAMREKQGKDPLDIPVEADTKPFDKTMSQLEKDLQDKEFKVGIGLDAGALLGSMPIGDMPGLDIGPGGDIRSPYPAAPGMHRFGPRGLNPNNVSVTEGKRRDGTGYGLKPQSLVALQAIQSKFPMVPLTSAVGSRENDAYEWHPNGRGLDMGIPDPFSPKGKALGDMMNRWIQANKDILGVQGTLWQVPDHFDHIHVSMKDEPSPLMRRSGIRNYGPRPRRGGPGGFSSVPMSVGTMTDLPLSPDITPAPPTPTPHGQTSTVPTNPISGQLDPFNTGRQAPNSWGYGPSPNDVARQQVSDSRAARAIEDMRDDLAELQGERTKLVAEQAKERESWGQLYKDQPDKYADDIEAQKQALADLDESITDLTRAIDDAEIDLQLDRDDWQQTLSEAQYDAAKQGRQGGQGLKNPLLPDLGELGGIVQGGLAETFLPPGFANPFDMPFLKAGSGILNFIGGLMPDPFTRGIFQAAAGVMSGDGGAAGAAMMSMIPEPFGTMQPASPGYAPGADYITPGGGAGLSLPVGAAIPGVEGVQAQPGPFGPPTGPLPGPGNAGNTTINLGPNYSGASIGQPGKDFVDMQQRDANATARATSMAPQRLATKGP